MFSPFEWIVILLIVFVIFGAGKLPQAGDALGRAVRNFRKASNNEDALDVSPRASLREERSDYPQLPPAPLAVPRPAVSADASDLRMPELGARRGGARPRAAIEDAVIGPELSPRRKS